MNQIVQKIPKKVKKKNYALMSMTIPCMIYMLINNYIPMFGISIAFKDFNYAKGVFGSDWIGLKNFEYLFKTTDAFIITRNTLLYNGSFIFINTVVAVLVAILLNELRTKKMQRTYQSFILMPYLISMTIVGFMAYSLLSMESGLLNNTVLPALGIEPIMWYSEPKYWPVILTFVNTWKNVGYFCVVYFAAVIGIDSELNEAATVDGATRIQRITKITLPLISPIIITMTLLQIGRIFYSDFGLFYQVPMNSGPIQSTTNVIDTYVYRAMANLGDIGMASAAGVYQSLVGFVLILVANYIVKKIDKESALF